MSAGSAPGDLVVWTRSLKFTITVALVELVTEALLKIDYSFELGVQGDEMTAVMFLLDSTITQFTSGFTIYIFTFKYKKNGSRAGLRPFCCLGK